MKLKIHLLFVSFVLLLFSLTNMTNAALIDNGDGTVTDDDTGLMWLKESFPRAGSAETVAKTWKQTMLWANGYNFAGHSDWRLPSALEVSSGVPDLLWNSTNNEWGHLYGIEWSNPANNADIAPMNHYPCCYYWTSTEHPENSAQAAAFFISYDGLWLNGFHPKDTPMRFTAVRGAPKPTIAPQCNDGYDNDSNGAADYPNDEGCSNAEDNWEYSCKGILGFFRCRYFQKDDRWWCFKIDDSTICLDRVYVIVGIIVIPWFGYWWFRRKKKSD